MTTEYWYGRLLTVGARLDGVGRLIIEADADTARALAPRLTGTLEVHLPGAGARLERLDDAADELAGHLNGSLERANTVEHQLTTLARLVLDDDLAAARDYLTELGFGLGLGLDGEEVIRGTAR